MKTPLLLCITLCITFLLDACGSNEQAGGTTVETTNGLAGVIEGMDAQTRVEVLLIDMDVLPGRDSAAVVQRFTVSADGGFRFAGVAAGRYRVLARAGGTGLAALSEALAPGLDSVRLALVPTGSALLSLQGAPLRAGSVVALPGTDVYAVVDSAALAQGVLRVPGLPAGSYERWALVGGEANAAALDLPASAMTVVSGAAVSLSLEQMWPWERAVLLNTGAAGLANAVTGLAVRLPLAWDSLTQALLGDSVRLCVSNSAGTLLPYALGAWDTTGGEREIWVNGGAMARADSTQWTLLADPTHACPAPDSATVFSAQEGYVAVWQGGRAPFDGATDARSLGDVAGEPQAYTLSAEVMLDSALKGGEVLSIGNAVGFRMDHLDSVAALYGYASYAGASNWKVISGYTPLGDSTWIRVDLVVDAGAQRFEVYFDGALHYASTEVPATLTYDKIGKAIVIGRHASGSGGLFQGRMGMVSVATVARSADWISLAALQSKRGNAFVTVQER